MELGTIIITGNSQAKNSSQLRTGGARNSQLPLTRPIIFWDLLGQNLLHRTIERLRHFGLQLVSVVNNQADDGNGTHGAPWERAFFDYARAGVERILLISLHAYWELNFADFLQFHRESQSPVSNVADQNGPVGITLVQAKCAAHGGSGFRDRLSAYLSCSSTYEFSGYVNRLTGPADYRQLVQHALAGLCQLKPVGREVKPGVWFGAGVRVSSSARICAPCYIAANTRVRRGASIVGSSLEQQCDIDCGTWVENSSILARTYLGPGLHVSQAIVSGNRLYHVGRNLDVDLADTGLVGRVGPRAPLRVLETLGALFGALGTDPALAVSTPSQAPASVDWVRSNGFFG